MWGRKVSSDATSSTIYKRGVCDSHGKKHGFCAPIPMEMRAHALFSPRATDGGNKDGAAHH